MFKIVAAKKDGSLFRFAGSFSVRSGRINGKKDDFSCEVKHFAHVAANAMSADSAVTEVDYAVGGTILRYSRIA